MVNLLLLATYLLFCFCCCVVILVNEFYEIIYNDRTFKASDILFICFLSLIPIINCAFALEPLEKLINPKISKWLKSFKKDV